MEYRLWLATKDGKVVYRDDWEDLGVVAVNRFSEPNCLTANRHDKKRDSTQVIARIFNPHFEMASSGAIVVNGLVNLEPPMRPDRLEGHKTMVVMQWVLEPPEGK